MEQFNRLCKACMTEIGEQKICPNCGYNQDEQQLAPYLPKESLLENRYAIGKKLTENPQGNCYIAYDIVSKSPVHIHEYLPRDFCTRLNGDTSVKILEDKEKEFFIFRENFLKYFRALARLRELSGIVPVFDIFIQNNTAYAVSDWIDGISLKQFIKDKGGFLDWDTARPLFMPLISSLTKMHSSGIGHFAINPDNLIVTPKGKIKLIGFSIPDIRKVNPNISCELNDGYSALEQYTAESALDETTDIYGFAASIFYSITGVSPKKATKRQEDDRIFISKNLLKELPDHVISALANALQVYPSQRTTLFERFRAEISAAPTVINEIKQNTSHQEEIDNNSNNSSISNLKISILSCTIALLVFIAIGGACYFGNSFNMYSKDTESSSEQISTYSVISNDESTANKFIVPSFVGQDYKKLQEKLVSSNGYTISLLSEEFSDSVQEGCIISQIPQPGSFTAENDAVIMVNVSKGSKIRSLPDIGGLSLSEASLKLTSNGFQPIALQESNTLVKEGYVIGYKDNNVGDKLEYGTKVNIVVSTGSN